MLGCSNSGIFGVTLLMRDVVTSSSSSCAFSWRLFPGATSGRKHHVYMRSHHVLEWKEDIIVDDRNTVNDGHLFNADLFSSSKCWGRRPLLIRNAFDHKLLLNHNLLDDIEDNVEFEWPSWKDVVEIASDDDAESRVISHVPGD